MSIKNAYLCTIASLLGLATSCSFSTEGEHLNAEMLARAARCQNQDENACVTDANCRPTYSSDPNSATGVADTFAGCTPNECLQDFVCPNGENPIGASCDCAPPLSCANVLCAPGHQCIEGIAGPVCVPICTDAAGCYCILDNGDAVEPGATFPAPDGCNTCQCDADGQISCTEIACECPLDFVCADGTLPQGPNCECSPPLGCANVLCAPGYHCVETDAQGPQCVPSCAAGDPNCECPLDFVCADGSLPQGPNCECPSPCDPDDPNCNICPAIACPDGSQPQGPDCACPPVCNDATDPNCGCPLDFVCADGTLPQGPDCACPPPPCTDANDPACQCPLDFVCADGTLPQGPNCECPPPLSCANVLCAPGHHCVDTDAQGPQCIPDCSNSAGQACGCTTANGMIVPPGTTFNAPDGCNTCVCSNDGSISCTEIACGN